MTSKNLAARLLATFAAELAEQSSALNAELLALEAEPTNAEHLRAVFRVFHTLKGAANAAAVPLLEQLCHALEDLLVQARDGRIELRADHFTLLFSAADALSEAAQRLREGADLAGARAETVLATLARVAPTAVPAAALTRQPEPPAPATPATPAPTTPAATAPMRVDPERLDALLLSTSELIVQNQRVQDRRRDLRQLRKRAANSMRTWTRAQHALADTPAAAHTLSLLQAVDAELRQLSADVILLVDAAHDDARALARTTAALTHGAQQLRMLPFSEATGALPRVVRDLAAGAQKRVQLEIHGGSVQADRAVLSAMSEALMQLVRNAVDHGVELPDVRVAAGKPALATVRIGAELQGDHIRVVIEDDGAGVDFDALRQQLAQRGDAVPQDEGELLRALTRQGISTRTEATAVSGRGVGLDIVHTALARVQGTVSVQSARGRGTRFVLQAPTSLVGVHALLCVIDEQVFALPAARVARVLRVRSSDVRRAEGRDVINFSGAPVQLVSLAAVLGPPLTQKPVGEVNNAVVLSAGDQMVACVVDDLLSEREIVVRPVHDLQAPPHVSGAVQLPTGRLALFLNAETVVHDAVQRAGATALPREQGAPDVRQRRRVMVVDDSITTRTLEQGILEAAGYEVLTAVDGAEAWRLIQESGCDLVVSDVEMPRMDGFALCQAIRSARRFEALPIILISALESAEHRARGLQLGADAYLGKSTFDQERLLQLVDQLIGPPTE